MHGGTPYPQALALPLSLVRAYFDSAVHQQQVKNAAAREQVVSAVIARFDAVLKALGGLARMLRRR